MPRAGIGTRQGLWAESKTVGIKTRSSKSNSRSAQSASPALLASAVAQRSLNVGLALFNRCDLYRLSFVLRQGAAERHAN
jgi:hypothetical protein